MVRLYLHRTEEIRIGTQSRHLHSDNTREVSVPAGNSKQVLKSVKLLNGKGASTILGINHDGKRMFVMKGEQKAIALNHFFHSCFNTTISPLSSEELMNWNYISDFKA